MKKEYFIDPTSFKDIVPNFCGIEYCKAGQFSGITTRDSYLIHCCIKGKGYLHDKFGDHTISEGELFIMRPGEITTYNADKDEPWEYAWIDFKGATSNIFNTDRSVYKFPIEFGKKLWQVIDSDVHVPSIYISLVFELIYLLFTEEKAQIGLVDKIIQYIEHNYMNDITINSLSQTFNFDRSYLFRTFKSCTGSNIKNFITDTRINQAKILLKNGYTISNTAYAVGYKNEFHFSKIFKQHTSVSPTEYKKGILK